MLRMVEINTGSCFLCTRYGLIPSNCWGLLGEASSINVAIILQQSDFRENGGYQSALFKSKTGGIIKKISDEYLEDVAILNSVKCIHPTNRKKGPPNITIDNCRHILQKQIEKISPKGIIISGAVAAKSLFDNDHDLIIRGESTLWNKIPSLFIGHLARSATNDEVRNSKMFITWLREI